MKNVISMITLFMSVWTIRILSLIENWVFPRLKDNLPWWVTEYQKNHSTHSDYFLLWNKKTLTKLFSKLDLYVIWFQNYNLNKFYFLLMFPRKRAQFTTNFLERRNLKLIIWIQKKEWNGFSLFWMGEVNCF